MRHYAERAALLFTRCDRRRVRLDDRWQYEHGTGLRTKANRTEARIASVENRMRNLARTFLKETD